MIKPKPGEPIYSPIRKFSCNTSDIRTEMVHLEKEQVVVSFSTQKLKMGPARSGTFSIAMLVYQSVFGMGFASKFVVGI